MVLPQQISYISTHGDSCLISICRIAIPGHCVARQVLEPTLHSCLELEAKLKLLDDPEPDRPASGAKGKDSRYHVCLAD